MRGRNSRSTKVVLRRRLQIIKKKQKRYPNQKSLLSARCSSSTSSSLHETEKEREREAESIGNESLNSGSGERHKRISALPPLHFYSSLVRSPNRLRWLTTNFWYPATGTNRIIRMRQHEERHSDMSAWLLNTLHILHSLFLVHMRQPKYLFSPFVRLPLTTTLFSSYGIH